MFYQNKFLSVALLEKEFYDKPVFTLFSLTFFSFHLGIDNYEGWKLYCFKEEN